MSREKRLRILPIGVTSKNRLTGAPMTRSIITSCCFFAPFKVATTSVRILKKTKTDVRIEQPRIISEKYLKRLC